jgi:hypothetical protein
MTRMSQRTLSSGNIFGIGATRQRPLLPCMTTIMLLKSPSRNRRLLNRSSHLIHTVRLLLHYRKTFMALPVSTWIHTTQLLRSDHQATGKCLTLPSFRAIQMSLIIASNRNNRDCCRRRKSEQLLICIQLACGLPDQQSCLCALATGCFD